jgi:hypothetical protein
LQVVVPTDVATGMQRGLRDIELTPSFLEANQVNDA